MNLLCFYHNNRYYKQYRFEHVDHYKNIKDLKNSFLKYIYNIPGFVALGIDNKNVKEIKERFMVKR